MDEILKLDHARGVFATTRWAVVKACIHSERARAKEALAELCHAYWQPIYACIRHHGYSTHDAEDLTQDFFVRLLSGNHLEQLDQAKGRFRAYLSVSLQNFLRDHWRRRWTWRRGRGKTIVSLDVEDAEASYARLPTTEATPQSLYERQWALTVINHALEQLKIEMSAEKRETLFQHFDAILSAETGNFPYEETARAMNLTVGALHGALHRWRRRFQILVREEIGRTVLTRAGIEDELRHLFECVGRPQS